MLSWDMKIRLDSQLSRMNCQIFSTGLRSYGEVNIDRHPAKVKSAKTTQEAYNANRRTAFRGVDHYSR